MQQKQEQQSQLTLSFLLPPEQGKPVIEIPLDFDYEPVDIISKQLTKLHSSYDYRVVYLGPRWASSAKVHRTFSKNERTPNVTNPEVFECEELRKYPFEVPIKTSMFNSTNMFKSEYYKTTIYYRAFEGMNPTIRDTVIFDSSFESSNLDCAIKVKEFEYDLFLRVDSNTRGHTLWYYFSVKNGHMANKVTLNICNISKHHNLYEKQGMKPYVFSKHKYKKDQSGWRQDCENVSFGKAKLRYEFVYEKFGKIRPFSKLSFDYKFQFPDDEVFFAYCIPYTYSYLLKQLARLPDKDQLGSDILERSQIGKSLMGFITPIVKITDPKIPCEDKKVIFVTGRIHPGETNGSIMVSQLMKYLCSPEGASIRKSTIFLIIPMVNPDGVVAGNYRTGASGKDLNRVYTSTNRELYPEICNIRSLIFKLQQISPIYMFLDFHGHSSKKNTFAYGPAYPINEPLYFKSKVLPKLLSTKTTMFRFYSCIFRISQGKRQTARAVMLQTFRIPYVYTIQSSNGFYYDGKTTLGYQRKQWEEIGKLIGISVGQYVVLEKEYEQFVSVRREVLSSKRKTRRSLNPQNSLQSSAQKFKHSQQSQNSSFYEEEEPLPEPKLPPSTTVFFLNMIEDIRNDQKLRKNDQDSEIDSDSGDDQEDLQPEKLAQFTKILARDYRLVDGKGAAEKNKRQTQAHKVHKQPYRKKSTQETDIQMEILNEMQKKKPASSSTKKRILSCGTKGRRLISGKLQVQSIPSNPLFIEKKEQEECRATSIFRLMSQDIKSQLEINQISQTDKNFAQRFQYNLSEMNKTQGVQKIQKNPYQRFSTSKLKKEPESQYLASSYFNFNLENQRHVFGPPAEHDLIDVRENPRKKALSQLNQRIPRTATSRQEPQRRTTQPYECTPKTNNLFEFSFSQIMPQSSEPTHSHVHQNIINIQPSKLLRNSVKSTFPASFYRIKQQLKGRRKEEFDSRNFSLSVKRAGL